MFLLALLTVQVWSRFWRDPWQIAVDFRIHLCEDCAQNGSGYLSRLG